MNIRQASYELVGGTCVYVGISVVCEKVTSSSTSEAHCAFLIRFNIACVQCSSIMYCHYDHLGSPRMVSDSTGNINNAYILALLSLQTAIASDETDSPTTMAVTAKEGSEAAPNSRLC